ncbi:AAA family ATPase [Salinibacterium sp. ZJ450]|uniref:AAA family ATPase n=1 Tax=Salinibacterium sp. ZJ450 TaxID=2708338 RepID=UPI00141F87EF|nr:AAA family ATPase [Salinibacterium sp. ZJ450]
MPALANYGQAIAATTLALRDTLAPGQQVTAQHPAVAHTSVSGVSANLFLYREELLGFHEGSEPRGLSRLIAQLYYLISVFPADDADTSAASHRAYGNVRAVVERQPVLSVMVGGERMQVQVRVTPLDIDDLTRLWLAANTPLRLSFAVCATFTVDAAERLSVASTLYDVVSLTPGSIAVFSGTDIEEKRSAVASVARELDRPTIRVNLREVVSEYVEATERNLTRLFDEAEQRDAVLILDEADPLFGTPTELGTAHDRYSGVDPDWLLTQLARAPGLVIIEVLQPAPVLARHTAVEVHFPPRDL